MTAEIISVGTELLLGNILNTNAQYLSRELAALGITVQRESTIGDNHSRLADFVNEAKQRCDLLVFTGGLGPTADDLTKETIAEAAGVSRSTVTSTLKALKSMGYVDYEPYSLVHLTEAGMHIGRDIAHRHIVIQEFFQHILQLEPNVSNDVACELEHVIPPDVIRRLGQFVLYLRSREDDWKNWQEDYKEIRLEHIQSNTDRDLVRNAPPMLAMRTQMMGQDELRKKYR